MTRAEIEAKFPTTVVRDRVRTAGWWDPEAGEEDWPTCQGRAIRMATQLQQWADDGVREQVALVSHAGFMEALLKAMLDRLPGASLTIYHFNSAITRLDLRPGHELHLRYLNRVPHLPQELVS